MPRKSIELSLDLMKRNSISQFIVKQLDDVTLEISLFENNKMYDISNATTRLFVGTNNDLYMQDSDIVISENKATIKLDRSILQDKGCAYAELEITDSNGSVATPSFLFDIDKRVSEGLKGNIEGFVEKYERLIAEFRVQVNNAVMDNYNRTTTAISVFETNGNVVISKIKSDGENAISTFNTNASNKLTEYENRFQKLTASQQQSAEVVDARDGEISLHARLERDLAKGKIIEETVSENYITIKDSVDGSITDIEILGNTVQSVSDLSDIQSAGTLQDDGLYKMSILSCGKNLISELELGTISSGVNSDSSSYFRTKSHIKVSSSKQYHLKEHNLNVTEMVVYFYKNETYISNLTIRASFGLITIPQDVTHIRIRVNSSDVQSSKLQLEEGVVATTYEEPKYNKSSILLPCQLEKVGDVSDRLFRREDGVWCIEKNIDSKILDTSKCTITKMADVNGKNRYKILITSILADKNIIQNTSTQNILSTIASPSTWVKISGGSEVGVCSTDNDIIFCLENVTTVEDFKILLNNARIIYSVLTPQIIELPLEQQIQLNSFLDTTNVFTEDTVIEPTIKCTIPKSLGASVQSLVNKTDILSNRIEKVETLQEGNELEISTDNGYVVCENTNNGQIEELKVEGKTLVNLSKLTQTQIIPRLGIKLYDLERVVAGQYYTIVYTIKTSTNDITNIRIDHTTKTDFPITVGTHVAKFRLNDTISGNTKIYLQGTDSSSITVENVILLEGDHTQNPPSYFEGLKSVGDGIDKIEVLSNPKSFIKLEQGGIDGSTGLNNAGTTTRLRSIDYLELVNNKTDLVNIDFNKYKIVVFSYDKDKNFIKMEGSWGYDNVTLSSNAKYFRFLISYKVDATIKATDDNFKIYQSNIGNKKQILYQTKEGNYEKPILRSTGSVSDNIEKHSDGKYYFHKRCGEVVLNGIESWSLGNSPAQTTVKEFILSYSQAKPLANASDCVICDKFNSNFSIYGQEVEGISIYTNTTRIAIKILQTKLSTQDVTGFKTWLSQNPVTVVYQLATEEVYECVNLDLDSYEGETSVIVDSGAISPKISFKIASHIANTIQVLKDRINYLEDKVIEMFKAVLAGDVQTLAYELYPEDFENSDTTEEVEILEDTSVVEETVEDTESLQNHT